MLNIDVKIERISNGYIVTDNDSTKVKRYYSSLADFCELQFNEYMQEKDKMFREYDADGTQLVFTAKLDELLTFTADLDDVKDN